MDSPYLFGDFDAAEFCLIAFFLFFAGLVFYLRREDRREGYPLEDDVTGRKEPLGGLFFTAQPKTFILPHGHGTRTLPRADNRDTQVLAARRSAMTDGSPIEPTGNPLLDGIGPGGYAQRPNYPDLTIDGLARIVPIRVAPDFVVSHHDTEPRGLPVLGCDGLKGGVVSDLWVDRSEQLIRYIEVDVGARKVLLPMNMAVVGARAVKVNAITAAQFAEVPGTQSADQVTLLEEERIVGYYGGGHLYATRDRQEPWL
ncbi:photosynthetic reaction center subunit H [Brevundimonas sp. LM2]|uniref:photosynthetic reaction center subunit H n=1 Tax=Brevundimonas sp. LM2 TaxID=1938605 RepID=UPI000983D603|nr:photosynthetic reaction center subunit H [Brevundimonas sp. LM2]AQR62914.1 photosynthetic reaction center subunit H [Brevundimonas sp. LM2]